MAYTRNPTWQDHPDTSTPITAAKLEHIEDGIEDAHDAIDALDARVVVLEEAPGGGGGGGAVDSVNGETGVVVLDAADVGAATTAQGAKADSAVQPADLAPYATDADLAAHATDTTGVHGIADTAALVLTSDARLSDARTPTAHAATHGAAGSDALAVTNLAIGSLADGQMLVRSGSALVGQAVPSGGGGGSSIWLTGTGSPEGVVTADPGTPYRDTAGTFGAWTWIKRTGTGTTGWWPMYANTGRRSITSAGLATGTIILQRGVGDLVTLRIGSGDYGLWSLAGGGAYANLGTIPAGYRIAKWNAAVAVIKDSNKSVIGSVETSVGDGHAIIVRLFVSYGGALQLQQPLSLTTADPYPTVDVGTPD